MKNNVSTMMTFSVVTVNDSEPTTSVIVTNGCNGEVCNNHLFIRQRSTDGTTSTEIALTREEATALANAILHIAKLS